MHEASSPFEWIPPGSGSPGERVRSSAPLARRRRRHDQADDHVRQVHPGLSQPRSRAEVSEPSDHAVPKRPPPIEVERDARLHSLVVTRSEGDALVVLLPRPWVFDEPETLDAPPVEVGIEVRKLTNQDVKIHLHGPRAVQMRRGEIATTPGGAPAPDQADQVGHLVIGRRPGQTIHLGERVMLEVVRLRGRQVRLRIAAPKQVRILRSELLG